MTAFTTQFQVKLQNIQSENWKKKITFTNLKAGQFM